MSRKHKTTKKERTVFLLNRIIETADMAIRFSGIAKDVHFDHFLQHKNLENYKMFLKQKNAVENIECNVKELRRQINELSEHLFNSDLLFFNPKYK